MSYFLQLNISCFPIPWDGRRPQIGDLINAKMNSLRTYGEGAAYALILALVLLLFVFIFKKLDKYEGVLANEK